MNWLRARLRPKLLLAFALVLLPVLALLWMDFRASVIRQDESILGDQLLTAQAVALQVDEAFDSLIGLGWAVAADPAVRSGDRRAVDERLRTLVEHLPHAELIAVYDESGTNRAWAGPGAPARHASLGEHTEFQRVMATSVPQVSEVLTLEGVGLPGIVAVVPLLDAEDRPNGVVLVGSSTDRLARRYENARLLPGQTIFLADRNGRMAFHTARRQMGAADSEVLASSEPLRTALAGIPVTQARFRGLMGEERLAAFAPSHKYRWVVGVTVPRVVALAPIERAFRAQLGGFAGILAASLGLAALLARYLVDPVRRLEAAAVALGRGDLSRRVNLESGDEIARLGTAFNTMATQLTQLYEEQRDLLRLREDFMQAAAHELKTPIATITSSIHLALSASADPAVRRPLQIVGRQTTRMNLLVEDLLTVTRLRGGPTELRRQRCDLASLVVEAVNRVASTDEKHAVALDAPVPLPVDADADLIGQLLVRLLENALTGSLEGGAVEVSARRHGGEAVVAFVDHGRGVPAARQEHLFEPFYEAVPSGQDGYTGVVSLRLAVCKRILDAHGGRIWFETTAGGGSTFAFAVPLAAAVAEGAT